MPPWPSKPNTEKELQMLGLFQALSDSPFWNIFRGTDFQQGLRRLSFHTFYFLFTCINGYCWWFKTDKVHKFLSQSQWDPPMHFRWIMARATLDLWWSSTWRYTCSKPSSPLGHFSYAFLIPRNSKGVRDPDKSPVLLQVGLSVLASTVTTRFTLWVLIFHFFLSIKYSIISFCPRSIPKLNYSQSSFQDFDLRVQMSKSSQMSLWQFPIGPPILWNYHTKRST